MCEGNFGLSVVTTVAGIPASTAEAEADEPGMVYFVGLPKTGSTSLYRLTRPALAPIHEFLVFEQMHAVTQHVLGAWPRRLLAQFHAGRQRQIAHDREGRRVKFDASTFNHRFASIILEDDPGAKMIFTVREPYPWVDSFLRQLVHSAEPCFYFGDDFKAKCFAWVTHPTPFPIDSFVDADTVRRDARGFVTLFADYWIKWNAFVYEQLAARDGGLEKNALVLRTSKISDEVSLEKLARFVGLAPDELAAGQSHANRAVLSKDNLLRDVDREWFDRYVAEHAPSYLAEMVGLSVEQQQEECSTHTAAE